MNDERPERTDMAGGNSPTPLFLTSVSLSSKTAIGIQTRHVVNFIDAGRHVHWDREDFVTRHPRSICLERTLAARLGPLKRPGRLRDVVTALGLRTWRDDILPARAARRLEALRPAVSVIYAVPITHTDTKRMRQVITLLDRPFVLHLWDILDDRIEASPDLKWLLTNAAKVVCLTEEMNRVIGQPGEPLVMFTRENAPQLAQPPVLGKPLRIALIGNVSPYHHGLDDMQAAHAALAAQGHVPEWIHIGPPATWKSMRHPARALMRSAGYVRTAAERDAILATCHAGFLPGPSVAPEDDARSRYSVPSRMLDFGALGLPVIGLVHPRSATAAFLPELVPTMCLGDSQALADVLAGLRDPVAWAAASRVSRAVFDRIRGTQPLETLAALLSSFQPDVSPRKPDVL